MIPEGHRRNFETLCRAADNGRLALMECKDTKTGKPAYVICMVNEGEEGGDTELVPVAKMFDENPYEEWEPPSTSSDAGDVT